MCHQKIINVYNVTVIDAFPYGVHDFLVRAENDDEARIKTLKVLNNISIIKVEKL